MIIIVNFGVNEDFSETPLLDNLWQTLSVCKYFECLPELWKLNDLYSDSVCKYLDIRKTQLIYTRLWGIDIDQSNNVGLIAKEKFYPIIKA